MFSWVSFNLICSVPNLPHHILVFQCRSMKLNWEGLGWKVFTNNSNNIQTLFESCLSILKATFFLLNSWFWWGTYFPQYKISLFPYLLPEYYFIECCTIWMITFIRLFIRNVILSEMKCIGFTILVKCSFIQHRKSIYPTNLPTYPII